MALAVRDFAADAVGSGAFSQPAVDYEAGDVVLLLARNASSVALTLVGQGSMTMLDTESDVYTLWGIVAAGSGTSSFTYDSASCRLGLAASVSGSTGLPTVVSSDFSTTSGHPTDGETYTKDHSAVNNCVIDLVESICIGDTATIAETSVILQGHATDGNGLAAVAGGIDTQSDPPSSTWTYHRNNAPGGGDTTGTGEWFLLFTTETKDEPLGFQFTRRRRRVDVKELPYQVSTQMVGGVVKRRR